MKAFFDSLFVSAGAALLAGNVLSAAEPPPPVTQPTALFDGVTLDGWEGNRNLWRVQDGALTGGSLIETVKENDFLATTRDYTNFVVRFKIKLLGTEGFINSGFQIRSRRVPKSSEMSGYQCDFGEPNWYGAIYDESRRNKVLSPSDMEALRPVLKRNDWNDYVIRADGPRITTWINGVPGTDYFETDAAISNWDWGKLGIQVHGGGKAVVQVKDITIEELPATTKEKKFIGAPEPTKSSKASPLTPEEEQAAFTLAPGFEIELVAAESDGIGKFVALDWDLQGRLWSMTALEYPVDANENPAVAKELYADRARDKVVVFERDPASATGYSSKARVFADGLAIPLGILPYKNGVYVQHGPDIVFLSDTDGDGRADNRDMILSGFGIQDSHLFPHQFTRAPGNWIWMAQGAFNYGKVRTARGGEVQFDQTRMARFRHDGSAFEITSQGPCNIWGLVLTGEGKAWIQEANDYGYPLMPFHEYANYPGCSDGQWKSYAPEFPGTAPDFRMGGTGLSGLALSDGPLPDSTIPRFHDLTQHPWPDPYAGIFFIANPIVRKIQAIKVARNEPRSRFQKLPDFVQSSDEWFRPVALRTGPDGCLYIVDWYNKIISHNEVPRNHPERDKKRGRIWRVRHKGQKPFPVPDFTKLSGDDLLARLGGPSLQQSHMAWQAITDRGMRELAPKLKAIIADGTEPGARRIASLWALEGLHLLDEATLRPMLTDASRDVRREALRAFGESGLVEIQVTGGHRPNIYDLDRLTEDPDPAVRAELIRTIGRILPPHMNLAGSALPQNVHHAVALLVRMAKPSLAQPTAKSTHNGRTIKVGEAYDREFERYLVRLFLERQPQVTAAFLDTESAQALPIENRLLATLALEPKDSATRVAQLLSELGRPPGQEALLRLAQFPDEPNVADTLRSLLKNSASSGATLEALLQVRTKFDANKLAPLLTETARALWTAEPSDRGLALRLISSFKLSALESHINEALMGAKPGLNQDEILPALRTLRELGANHLEGIVMLAKSPRQDLADEAIMALASSRNELAPEILFTRFWKDLSAFQHKTALNSLCRTKPGARAAVKAARQGAIARDELDAVMLDKLHTVLGEDQDLAGLMREMASLLQPVVRFDGRKQSCVSTKLTLTGPFTVECWLKLDAGIGNQDGILAGANQLDLNFFDSRFRAWVAGGQHDIVLAKRKTVPDVWTHYAVTRDAEGVFRLYINGELDATSTNRNTNTFVNLDVGRTNPENGGTAGWMTEFRVWNIARAPERILTDFDRSFGDEFGMEAGGNDPRAPGLIKLFTGRNWPSFHGVRLQNTLDAPPLLNSTEAKAAAERFARFRAFADKPGDIAHGQVLFKTLCNVCHSVSGQGGQVGPVLNGAGATGVESILRNILTPNAAMEPGYRIFRVELKDGDLLDGFLVSQDKEAIVLRRPNLDDARIAQRDVRKADFTKASLMPEGLLDALKPDEVSDLFAYLKTLR